MLGATRAGGATGAGQCRMAMDPDPGVLPLQLGNTVVFRLLGFRRRRGFRTRICFLGFGDTESRLCAAWWAFPLGAEKPLNHGMLNVV